MGSEDLHVGAHRGPSGVRSSCSAAAAKSAGRDPGRALARGGRARHGGGGRTGRRRSRRSRRCGPPRRRSVCAGSAGPGCPPSPGGAVAAQLPQRSGRGAGEQPAQPRRGERCQHGDQRRHPAHRDHRAVGGRRGRADADRAAAPQVDGFARGSRCRRPSPIRRRRAAKRSRRSAPPSAPGRPTGRSPTRPSTGRRSSPRRLASSRRAGSASARSRFCATVVRVSSRRRQGGHLAVGEQRRDDDRDDDVFVSQLRRKLEAGGAPRLVHTVRGIGFTLEERRDA